MINQLKSSTWLPSLAGAMSVVTMPVFANDMGANKQAQEDKPNVLVLFVDDWGAHDLSCTGSSFYETPNLDALSEQSNMFNNAYVAYPRSVPSRYSLITGRHCAKPQEGCKADERSVGEDEYCIAMPFHDAGYTTFYTGKWHLVDGDVMPEDKGFDLNIGGGHAGAPPTYFAPFKKENTKPKNVIHGMEDAKDGEYLTDYMANKVVDYIKTPRKEPFFAICAFYAVHTPLEAPKELEDQFVSKKKQLNLKKDPMMQQEAGVTKTQQDDATYAAMIASVDQGVGKMIQALKATGQYDNTIIVVLSDHGGLSNRGAHNKRRLATTNFPLKAGKGHLYEGGIRVPMMIHLPTQKKQVVHQEPVVSMDLLPTLTDLCNVKVDPTADLDGISLKKLIKKGKQKELLTRPLFWHKAAERPDQTGDYVSTAIRIGDYKLLDFYNQGRVELYNLKKDEGEAHNLVDKEPKKAEELLKQINIWRKTNQVNMYDPKKEAKKQARKAARKTAQKKKAVNEAQASASWSFKKLGKEFGKNFYIGVANSAVQINKLSGKIADKEFDYITPANDFKQTYIHPVPDTWRWEKTDLWIKHAQEAGHVLRLHSPISPQCAKWIKADDRKPEELEKMLEEYLSALYLKYASAPSVKWIDVVNETIAAQNIDGLHKKYTFGDWFGPRKGDSKWENPWTQIGFEKYEGEEYPLYISKAFELATKHCRTPKLIINQHGKFEKPVWDKMKKLVKFLRHKGYRVDGIGWQCHIDVDWQLQEDNLKRLDEFISWCHDNNLSFHITEMNVWLKEKIENKYQHQSDTYTAIIGTLLDHVQEGEIGVNFWNVRDTETQHADWEGCLWNEKGEPKPAVEAIKKMMASRINNRTK